ncbi:hypothetical protein U0070_001481 [Myodes glareolus]|uniref:Uncharacterized protein n=1 Tax=Myodes glareolus TaxID=447135 RepID=A0AAW0H263_MYOGA
MVVGDPGHHGGESRRAGIKSRGSHGISSPEAEREQEVGRGYPSSTPSPVVYFLGHSSTSITAPPPSQLHLLKVQEGERPNRLDPQNPAYAEETGPSVIVNGFSERLRASHSQRIRPNSENLARSRPRSVPVRLALVNSHQIRSLVSVGDSIPRSTDFVFHVPPPSAPPPDLGGLNLVLQFSINSDTQLQSLRSPSVTASYPRCHFAERQDESEGEERKGRKLEGDRVSQLESTGTFGVLLASERAGQQPHRQGKAPSDNIHTNFSQFNGETSRTKSRRRQHVEEHENIQSADNIRPTLLWVPSTAVICSKDNRPIILKLRVLFHPFCWASAGCCPSGKAALVLAGHYSRCSTVMVKNSNDGTSDSPYSNTLVAGIDCYLTKLTGAWARRKPPKVKDESFHENECSTDQVWQCAPLIPALGRQRQEDLYEFKASLVYSRLSQCL